MARDLLLHIRHLIRFSSQHDAEYDFPSSSDHTLRLPSFSPSFCFPSRKYFIVTFSFRNHRLLLLLVQACGFLVHKRFYRVGGMRVVVGLRQQLATLRCAELVYECRGRLEHRHAFWEKHLPSVA